MNNPIAKTAIILLLIFFQCHGVVAQSGVNDNLLKRKAVSTLAADQKKTPTKAKTLQISLTGYSCDSMSTILNSSFLNEHTPFAHPRSASPDIFF